MAPAGFANASGNISIILNEDSINTVAIATQHNSHAELVIRALEAGKNV